MKNKFAKGNKKYSCPCCGYKVFKNPPPGNDYSICPICFWEDDPIGFQDPDLIGGANNVSLRQAQKNFVEFGACTKNMLHNIRPPNKNDILGSPKKV